METFRIGDYEIEPQVSETTARVVVRRKPNPHGVTMLYVNLAHGEGGPVYLVRDPAGSELRDLEDHPTWSRGIGDAINRIEAHHARLEAESVRKENERVSRERQHRDSMAELREFMKRQDPDQQDRDRDAFNAELDRALTPEDPHRARAFEQFDTYENPAQ